MMLRRLLLSMVLLLTLGALLLNGQTSTDFIQTYYYLLSMGEVVVDTDALTQTLQGRDFTVIAYDGDSATVYRGAELAGDVSVEGALLDEAVLVVDGERFYLRIADTQFTYAVRPAGDGYELVVSPSQNVAITDALASILMSLQEMSVLGNSVDLEFAAFAKNDLKGPPPPGGASIDSLLYRLVIAEDWFAFAAANSLALTGLRLDVVAEKLPGGSIPEVFAAYAYEETEQLAKLLVPVDRLVALASAESIGYVRPPYQPAAP
ncbi:hypothetical protein KJ567_05490 [Candidatus Bipolaricaulota bacterium]|nr:hypothetical protein [Candidatus Bipolaricaulota bacterium]